MTIPASVTKIGARAFSGCNNLLLTVANGNAGYCCKDNCLIDTKSATLVWGNKHSVIPSDGSVTSVGSSAFAACKDITSITIPHGVTSIGDLAFRSCSALNSVDFPDSLSTVGSEAFYYCKSLENINLPDSVTSIGSEAFRSCDGLVNITIPNSVVEISSFTFGECRALISVTLPDSLERIQSNAFSSCERLAKITIPASVTVMGEEAFGGCDMLTVYCEAAEKPENWNSAWNKTGDDAVCNVVWDCKNNDRTADGFIYTVIDGIAYRLKDGKAAVVSASGNSAVIELPASVTYSDTDYIVSAIDRYAFRFCDDLGSVTIPDTVKSIGYEAFSNCGNLTRIIIPKTVTKIDERAFGGCVSLTVYCEAAGPQPSWQYRWSGDCPVVWNCVHNDKTGDRADGSVFTVIDGVRYELYNDKAIVVRQPKNISVANIRGTVVYNGKTYVVNEIARYAFYGCEKLTSVTLPNSIVKIGEEAFYGCYGLTSITIPTSVTEIDRRVFYGCYNLTIYCKAESLPETWYKGWNFSHIPVIWDSKS